MQKKLDEKTSNSKIFYKQGPYGKKRTHHIRVAPNTCENIQCAKEKEMTYKSRIHHNLHRSENINKNSGNNTIQY